MSTNIPNNKGQNGKPQNNRDSKKGTVRSGSKSGYISEKAVSNPVPGGSGGKKNK